MTDLVADKLFEMVNEFDLHTVVVIRERSNHA